MEATSAFTLIILFLFQIPRDAKHKLIYVAKKIAESTGVSDFLQTVLFGEIPASSLGQVTAFLDEVIVSLSYSGQLCFLLLLCFLCLFVLGCVCFVCFFKREKVEASDLLSQWMECNSF